jgi:hypothetical protein
LRRGAWAVFALLCCAAPTWAYTVTDFAVDPAHATLGDPHQVASPPFNQFQLTIYGSFNVNKCYQVKIKREGSGSCGSANSSGSDDAVVFADHLLVDVSPTQQNADFKGANNWRIEIKERSAGCTDGSSTQTFPDSSGEPYLKISGCNGSCLLSGLTFTAEPNPVGCGGAVEVCAKKSGGGTLGSGNLEYHWDIDGNGVCGTCSGGSNNGKKCGEASDCPGGVCGGGGGFTELTTHTGDPGCAAGQPCCITVNVNSTHTVGVKVRDLGTQVVCSDCKTTIVSTTNDCDDHLFCNGAEACDPNLGCVPGTPPNCSDNIACTVDGCIDNAPCDNGNGNDNGNSNDNGSRGGNSNDNGNGNGNDNDDDDCVNHICTHTPSSPLCNDGLFCNGSETCHETQGCNPGSPVNCTDGVACTADSCNEASDSCDHTPNNGACNDGLYCNGDETCHATQGCKPGTSPNCDDNVACTIDSCDEGSDSCKHKPSNSMCNDGLWCNGVETCHPTLGCQPGTPPNCNDGVACTTDTCNESNDTCIHTPVHSVCSDGQFCNGSETCHATLGCQAGTVPNCNDAVACTSDSCNEDNDTCAHAPNNGSCNDNLYCNGAEVCHATLGCQAGSAVNCSDGLACTTDSCNEANDTCIHTPDNGSCSDGLWCNGTETCHPTLGCQSGTAPNCDDGVTCTADSCNESNDSCTHTPNNGLCNDGLYCNGTETCHLTQGCQTGTAPNCADNVACTTDTCNEATDSCNHTTNNSLCSDGLFCNGAEYCHATKGCKTGTAPNCADNVACTTDSCDEAADQCQHTPNSSSCGNGLFCDGQEICDPLLGCLDEADPCNPPLICDEPNDRCLTCTTNAQCDDGVFCNGAETCNTATGSCVAGMPPTCSDGVACTVDACNTATDSCEHAPDHGTCGDGLYCNGAEVCHPTLGCQAGTPVACGDGVSCTVDSCDEVNDVCVQAPNHTACSDGLYCTGVETCHPTLGCQAGSAPNCNDGVSCTNDACNEATDSCTHAPTASLCDDGQFCNGAEVCDALNGCQAGTAPDCNDGVGCTVDACDEATDTCAHTTSNALCGDGQYCNGSETCHATLGCQAGTSPNCDDTVACTLDACNEATDSCDHTPNNGACGDGLHCNGVETCHPMLGCQGGTAPNCNDNVACTTDACDEATDSCIHTPGNGSCDDGAYCNGSEVCDPLNGCHAGTAPNCDDGVTCTVDACNEATDSCTHTPGNSQCGDGLYCNGTETCHPTLGCQAGAPVVCDDVVACTANSCDEAIDACVYAPDNSACGDGLYCNGTEYCHPMLGCQSGILVNCDDGIPCTADACDETTDSCTNVPNHTQCNDAVFCNGVEVCHLLLGCQPGSPVNCGDGIDCTVDACDEATDLCTHSPSNSSCNDGLYCNGSETCHPTLGCQGGTGPNCDDGVSCTVDSCDEATDSCQHAPDHAACSNDLFCDGEESCDPVLGCIDHGDPCAPPTICDEPNDRCVDCLTDAHCNDGLFCNGTETCNITTGFCVPGTPPACNDGLACTMDSCSPASDSCAHAPDHSECDDGQYCNGSEFCDPGLGCQPGTPVNCDDGVACTSDGCDEINNACTHTPDPQSCDNTLFCDGVEVCDPVHGCQDGPNPCSSSLCDEPNDRCVECLTNAHCDDSVFCNGAETCNTTTGQCVAGTPPTCSDGVPCTVDVCNPATDSCVNTASDAACSDGQYCNGVEVCNATLGCQAGTPPNCNDTVGCTVDSCNEATDSCRHKPSDSLCADSSYCNGVEVCDPVNGCEAGAPPVCDDAVACSVDSCDESGDVCVYVPNNGACSDGLYCNGVESCDAVLGCLAGTPPNCNDVVACTADACNEATDVCDHTPGNGACDNGLFCDGVESCDPLHGCVSGAAPNCNDGVACTIDVCDEAGGACVHSPNNAACDDQQFCNGVEVCDLVDGCLAGSAPNCGDGVGCTIDSCDESTDTCVHAPSNGICDDGLFCNGLEVCDPINGCGPGTAPNCDDGVECTLDSCDETGDVCVHSPDHGACDDGLYCDGTEICDVLQGCQEAPTGPCPANLYCNETIDMCVDCLSDVHCLDAEFCNGVATCVSGICVPGAPPSCNDGIPCTVDSCDPASDACIHVPSDFTCNDNVFCNGTETCSATQGCLPGTPPVCDDGLACTVDVCSPASDSCVSTPDHGACSDGLYCNGEEVCNPVTGCGPGVAPGCDDGIACTIDGCDEATDSCLHAPNDAVCSDGQYCNGVEVCDPINGCQSGPPVLCDDAVLCTVDACNEATDSCTNAPSDALCGDGQFCNGVEVCHPALGCQGGTPPNCNDSIACTTDACNEDKDLCVNAPVSSTCSDGLYCNGEEVCIVGVGCQGGTAPNCNDGIPCTTDACNENTDSCANTPHSSQCDDGVFCNGAEICDVVDGCQAGTPPNCNDLVGCTVDSCDETTDSCVNTPQNGLCDDGAHCNGVETCKPGVGCAAGLAPNCDDNIGCTLDSCDEANNKCLHIANVAICDDGQACTEDACTASGCLNLNTCGACCMNTGDCINGVNFAECMGLPGDNVFLGFGSVCRGDSDGDGADDACGVDGVIPTVSEWGLVVLALLLLIGAKVYFGTRRQAA